MNYRTYARRVAQKYGLDPDIFERQINAESGFQTGRSSGKGAQGIAQIMPDTARGWGVDPNNPTQALDAAAKNMADYVKKYGGYENALRAYNAGPAAVERSRSFPETNAYVRKILGGKDPGKLGATSAGAAPSGTSAITSSAFDSSSPTAGPNLFSLFASMTPTSNPFQERLKQGWQMLSQLQQQTQSRPNPIIPSVGGTDTPDGGGGNADTSGEGTVKFDGKPVAAWIAPALAYARKHGWKGTVNSGFRSFEEQTRIYNSGVRPAAKPGHSHHEGAEYPRGAVDVSDPETLSRILANSPWRKKLQWAGSRDPVHFSHQYGGGY